MYKASVRTSKRTTSIKMANLTIEYWDITALYSENHNKRMKIAAKHNSPTVKRLAHGVTKRLGAVEVLQIQNDIWKVKKWRVRVIVYMSDFVSTSLYRLLNISQTDTKQLQNIICSFVYLRQGFGVETVEHETRLTAQRYN
jgi:hypothetical protein